MAKGKEIQVKAQRLMEYEGWSADKIATFLGDVTPKTIENWKSKYGWVTGKNTEELREKERLTVLAEAEAAGITKARHLRELALIGYSDIQNHVEDDPGTGTRKVRSFAEMNKLQAGASRVVKKIKERRTVRKDPDKPEGVIEEITTEIELHAKEPVLKEISDILGVKKVEQEAEKTNDTIISLIRSFRPK
jgi:hypothetical protein